MEERKGEVKSVERVEGEKVERRERRERRRGRGEGEPVLSAKAEGGRDEFGGGGNREEKDEPFSLNQAE